MTERWRVGTKIGKNLYRVTEEHPEGEDIGRMDTPEVAAQVVMAVNHQLSATGFRWEYGVEGRWPDGEVTVDLRGTQEAAEAVLAARARIEGNVVQSRLVRRLVTFGPVEEVPDGDR